MIGFLFSSDIAGSHVRDGGREEELEPEWSAKT